MSVSYVAIVGPNDSSIFEHTATKNRDDGHLMRQFMLYSSLDVMDDTVWRNGEFHMAKVDRPFGDKYHMSAFVGLAPIKLLVMQDTEPKDSLKTFFVEAYELTVKHLMNPFSDATRSIESARFNEGMIALYNRYL